MVYIIGRAYSVRKSEEIVDRRKNIVYRDMLRAERGQVILDSLLYGFLALVVFQNVLKDSKNNVFFYIKLAYIEVDKVLYIDHAVGKNLNLYPVALVFENIKVYLADALLLKLTRLFF